MNENLIPCFSFRPNWQEGVIERLSFQTGVLRADRGAEQRYSSRRTPRRTIEADFMLHGPERAFYDLFMHRLSPQVMAVPLYWDVAPLPHGTVAGNTTRLNFDTLGTEFKYCPAVILQADSAFDFEVVQVQAVDDTGITLASATSRSWKRGVRVMPVRRAIIDDMGALSQPSADVANVTARFLIADENPWIPAADTSPVYNGLPVYLEEPNWVDGLESEFAHDTRRFDPGVGLPYQKDVVGRANVGQAHAYFLDGRERLARFRDLAYRHQGRRGGFWLPTFKRDLELTNSPIATATKIEVENVGLGYVGGPGSGREHIVIWTHTGQAITRKITGVTTAGSKETLDLDAALGLALSPGQVRKISFLDTARFDQDDFEIDHRTSSQGLTEVRTAFRTFKNSRVPAGVIESPIPAGVPSDEACGVGGQWKCAPVVFEGWVYLSKLVMVNNNGLPGQIAYLYDEATGDIVERLADPSPAPRETGAYTGNGNSQTVWVPGENTLYYYHANPDDKPFDRVYQQVQGSGVGGGLQFTGTLYGRHWYELEDRLLAGTNTPNPFPLGGNFPHYLRFIA